MELYSGSDVIYGDEIIEPIITADCGRSGPAVILHRCTDAVGNNFIKLLADAKIDKKKL